MICVKVVHCSMARCILKPEWNPGAERAIRVAAAVRMVFMRFPLFTWLARLVRKITYTDAICNGEIKCDLSLIRER